MSRRDSSLHTIQEAEDHEWTKVKNVLGKNIYCWDFFDSLGNYKGYSKIIRSQKEL